MCTHIYIHIYIHMYKHIYISRFVQFRSPYIACPVKPAKPTVLQITTNPLSPASSEGKQYLLKSSESYYVHNKALQTKDSASICNNNILPRRIHKLYNDVDEILVKRDNDGLLQCANRSNAKQYGNGKGQILAPNYKRNR